MFVDYRRRRSKIIFIEKKGRLIIKFSWFVGFKLIFSV